MKNMGQARFRRVFIEWGIFGLVQIALIVVLVGGLFVVDWIAPRSVPAYLGLTAIYMVGFTISMIVFWVRVNEATMPRPYREAKKIGIPASGTVVEAMETGITSGGRRSIRPRHYEYQVRLRIDHPNLPAYEAETTHYFRGGEIPKKGAVLGVKVHPQQPEVVVIA